MQHQQSTITTPPVLEGRVFARQQLFMMLPQSLQKDAKQFRAFVEQDKTRLFRNHHHALVKSVYSVKGKELIDAIIQWLPERSAPVAMTTTTSNAAALKLETASPNGTVSSQASTTTDTIASDSSDSSVDVTKKQLETAKQVAEALVLMGFLTPYKEDDAQLTCIAADHYVTDSELLIPVAPSVTDLTTTSVWSVADGAVYARSLKRKAGLLGKLTDGKDVYVVFNANTTTAYLFESDLAREPMSELSGAKVTVQFDSSQFDFGVRVSAQSTSIETTTLELFNAETKEIQAELVKAWLGIGAMYEDVPGSAAAGGHSDTQYVGTFAHVPDHSVGGYVPAALVNGQQADFSVPISGGEHHSNHLGGHSPTTAHHDQALAGTAAYAPIVSKHSNSGDELPAPHVTP